MISGCGLEVGSGGIGPSRKRRSLARMSQLGHEERFPPTRLSAGCGFRKETIAGMGRNGREAPLAVTNPVEAASQEALGGTARTISTSTSPARLGCGRVPVSA